jgi:ribonuclease VapC
MILDTSAVLAVLMGEPERDSFIDIIVNDPIRIMSAVSILEAGIVLEARYGSAGAADLDHWLQIASVRIEPFDINLAGIARFAWSTYGKGRHPAGLNFGDCCVYALASALRQPLLCKGNDFPLTDLNIVTF